MKEESTASTNSSSLYRFFCMLWLKQPKRRTVLKVPPHALPKLSTNARSREFELVFHYFDEDGDGKISPVELCKCMRTLGEELSPKDAEAAVESDGDGLLGFDDFMKLVDVEGEEENGRSLRDAFRVYEMEGKGCITAKSLRRALHRLGESTTIEECKKMIRRFDLNRDGVISFEEFRSMMI